MTNELWKNPLREGLSARRAAEPCTVVVLGITGDLAARKLAPALFNLYIHGHLPQRFAMVGMARRPKSDDEIRAEMREALDKHSRAKPTAEQAEAFLSSLHYHQSEFDDAGGYERLAKRLDEVEKRAGLPGNRLFYLSTSPEFFTTVLENLDRAALVKPPREGQPWQRVIIEKPFGKDLRSAKELNAFVKGILHESQVYRIDHYLGKETVQNILAFRFANSIFEPIWSSRHVEQVQITVAESIGMEGRRGQYYDTAGAVRDMVQNHMLQLLCLTAMEPPASLEAESLRDEKVRLLRAIRPMEPREVRARAIRGQYGPGSLNGQPAKAYREELEVDPASTTETFAAIRLAVSNWRWAGVPFLLRHGKRLPKKASEIAVRFKRPPHQIFGGPVPANTLVIRVQPDEGISLSFEAKRPGLSMDLQNVKMDFRYGSSFGQPAPEAYERLLLDGLVGDRSLFPRDDEVELAWGIIQPVLDTWAEDAPGDFPNYPAGAWGPKSANELVKDLETGWRRL